MEAATGHSDAAPPAVQHSSAAAAAAADALLSWRAAEVIAPFGPHYPTMLNGLVG